MSSSSSSASEHIIERKCWTRTYTTPCDYCRRLCKYRYGNYTCKHCEKRGYCSQYCGEKDWENRHSEECRAVASDEKSSSSDSCPCFGCGGKPNFDCCECCGNEFCSKHLSSSGGLSNVCTECVETGRRCSVRDCAAFAKGIACTDCDRGFCSEHWNSQSDGSNLSYYFCRSCCDRKRPVAAKPQPTDKSAK
jgi:hypothetical protein